MANVSPSGAASVPTLVLAPGTGQNVVQAASSTVVPITVKSQGLNPADFLQMLTSTNTGMPFSPVGAFLRVGYTIIEGAAGGPAPFLAMFGANGGFSQGIDSAAATPGRDWFLGKVGGVAGGTPGSVYDLIYAAHRGALPPVIQIGNSSAFTPNAQLQVIMAADGSGNILDNTLTNVVIHTALITGGTPQTTPALRIVTWQSGTDRMRIENDGSITTLDAGGGIQTELKALTGRLNIGSGAAGNATDTVRIKPGSGDATFRLATNSFAAILATASNSAQTASILTSTAASLALGTNSIAVINISATQGLGFFGGAAVAKPTVTGAKGANAALGSLMTALSGLGLVVDSTTA